MRIRNDGGLDRRFKAGTGGVGVLVLVVALGAFAKYSDGSKSECGNADKVPRGKALIGDWSSYRCMDQSQAGTRWASCLNRVEYSETAGRGCEGEQKCCPATTAVVPAKKATPAGPKIPARNP